MSLSQFLKGTFLLTAAGFLSRIIGFFYRIFLSHTIGAKGLGLYQLVTPLSTLVSALTVSGIQTVISQRAAARLAAGREKEARDCFCAGTLLSVGLSAAAAFLLFENAAFFASGILNEPDTQPLIRILSLSLPFAALHSCVNSYYLARKKAGFPAGMQLLEQAVRVGASYLIYCILISEGIPITAVIAAGGALISELIAALTSLLIVGFHFLDTDYSIFRARISVSDFRMISSASLPLTLNRLLLTLLGSMEVVLIPQRLRLSGLSQSDALGVYGVFTGMALPFLLFPAALTNSASSMLTPSVAGLKALGYRKHIRRITGQVLKGVLTLGAFCTCGFYFFGPALGRLFFNSPTAGNYMKALSFICPFLYVNTTLTGILKGLEKNNLCLAHSMAGILIRLSFVLFAIPVFGIRGYFCGILLSEIVQTLLHAAYLLRFDNYCSPHSQVPVSNKLSTLYSKLRIVYNRKEIEIHRRNPFSNEPPKGKDTHHEL